MSDQLLISMAEAAQLLGLTKPQLYELTRSRSRITHKPRQRAEARAIFYLVQAQRNALAEGSAELLC